jgi:PDZ domain
MRTIALALAVLFCMSAVGFAADSEKEAKEKELKAKERAARQKEAEKRFAKLPDYCKERRVTHVVELLAEWGEFADLEQQDAVAKMARAIFDDAAAEVKKTEAVGGKMSFPDLRRTAVSADADTQAKVTTASAFFVDTFESTQPKKGRRKVREDRPWYHVIVSSRTLTAFPNDMAERCVILTNASMSTFRGLDCCVVLSSGSVVSDRMGTFDGSVVVCRGDVAFRYDEPGQWSSFVAAGGSIRSVEEADFLAKKQRPPQHDPRWAFPNNAKLLGVKFYSAAEDGLWATVEKNEDVVVTKLDEKKPFAKAGLKVGDVIDAINGEPVPSLHELDRLLVRATVSTGVAKLKVSRGKAPQVIEVKLADW